jgi:hypothetical protein
MASEKSRHPHYIERGDSLLVEAQAVRRTVGMGQLLSFTEE